MTIVAGSPDSWATQNFDYNCDMPPTHTAADTTLDMKDPVNNRVQLCPAAVLAAVNRGNNMQARQLIPTWLLLQSDSWARQAQHPIPQDAVTHMEHWLLTTKGSEMRKAKSMQAALNAAAHVARTSSITLFHFCHGPEHISTHYKQGREFFPRKTHYLIIVHSGQSRKRTTWQRIFCHTQSVGDLIEWVQSITGLETNSFLLSRAKFRHATTGTYDSKHDILFQPTATESMLHTWISDSWGPDDEMTGEFNVHLTMGHEKTRNPTITVVFEQWDISHIPFRTLINMSTALPLHETKTLIAKSTRRRTGCNIHVDNITVDMPTPLTHAVTVRWHVNQSPSRPPIPDHWMQSLQPRQQSADATDAIMVQWDDKSSYIGVHEYNTIDCLMKMVSRLTGYNTGAFRLQATSGGLTAPTTLVPTNLLITDCVNLDHGITVNLLHTRHLDRRGECDTVTLMRSLSSESVWLLGHDSAHSYHIQNTSDLRMLAETMAINDQHRPAEDIRIHMSNDPKPLAEGIQDVETKAKDLHPLHERARVMPAIQEKEFPFDEELSPDSEYQDDDTELYMDTTNTYQNPAFWPVTAARTTSRAKADLPMLSENTRHLAKQHNMEWSWNADVYALHNSARPNIMPRCHVHDYAGAQQIAALDTNDIQAIDRMSMTLRGPYSPERVLSSLTQHFARMLNVTHLHVNGNNTTPRELNMTAIAEMPQLRHLELHRIINGVYLPQGDKMSTLTYLHLDKTTPLQVTEPWWEFDDSGEMFRRKKRQSRWHGPSTLLHLNIQRNTSTQLYHWIAELTNLMSLRILQPRARAPLRLPCLAHLSTLTHLDISNGEQAPINMYACAHLSNLSLARLYHFHTLKHLKMLEITSTLQHLDIRKCFRLPHSAFSTIHGAGLAILRLCGLPMLFQLPSLQHAWALQELSIKTCINLECMREGIQYMTSITSLRLRCLQGLRRLPPLSHLTKICLLDVQDTWNITNLADTIADLRVRGKNARRRSTLPPRRAAEDAPVTAQHDVPRWARGR